MTPKELDKLLGAEAVHQGVALEVEPVSRFGLNDIDPLRLMVVLDQVTDPHNVGAILRTACAFGADALVTTQRYAPRETGVMAKAASGALDLVPLIEVRNLGDTLELLKKRGMRVLGFDSEAPAPLAPRAGGEALAIVLGAEGKGLRQRTRELCDEMVRLDMPGPIKSLNVSNAAAIALFAATAAAANEKGPRSSAARSPTFVADLTACSAPSPCRRRSARRARSARSHGLRWPLEQPIGERRLAIGQRAEIAVTGARPVAEGRAGDHREVGSSRCRWRRSRPHPWPRRRHSRSPRSPTPARQSPHRRSARRPGSCCRWRRAGAGASDEDDMAISDDERGHRRFR